MEKIRLCTVKLDKPCSACHIVNNLTDEVVGKLVKLYPDLLETSIKILETPKEMRNVEGLEVEKFPALFINEEQVTASTIPNRKELMFLIDSIIKENEN